MDNNSENFEKIIHLPLSVSNDLLYYYVLLVITGNFNSAAHTLGITAQGLNKAIDTLENILKCKLVERENGYKGLTFEGKILFEKARNTFENIKNMTNGLIGANPGKNELINIVWFKDYYTNVLPDVLAGIMSKNPDVFFKVHLISDNNIVEQLISYGLIDIGLTVERPSLKNLAFIEGKKIPYIIVGKPRPAKCWHELDYISMPRDSRGEVLTHMGKYPRRTVNSENSELDFELCENSMAATFVLESKAKDHLDKGTLARIAEPPEQVSITPFLVYNKNISLTATVKELIEKLKQSF